MNMWNTAFVEEIEPGKWAVSRPNEFQNNEIFIEMEGFTSRKDAEQALKNASVDSDQEDVNYRYWGMLGEHARM